MWPALVICLALATSYAYADGKPCNAKDTAAYSFKGCLESGGDISKTSPRRCTTNKGVAFIEQGRAKRQSRSAKTCAEMANARRSSAWLRGAHVPKLMRGVLRTARNKCPCSS